MHKNEKWIKPTGTVLCEIFTVCTIIMLLAGSEPDRLLLACATLLLAALPMLLEKLLRCRISLPVYIFALAYAIGPMLGHCWKLYYTVPVWDKLLHISGGVMFAILGAYFFDLLAKNKDLPAVRIIFALCFSMAIAVLWEFCEFGADQFLGMDMQDDTVIHSLTSYLLGDRLGVTGSIENIQSVAVNGIPLPGYIDIGLIDSMLDMLLETLGAIVTCLFLWLDKGRHPLIQAIERKITREKRDTIWPKDM
ncbi:MAG: hypothetical protein IJX69_00690 [Oscillospiraceae bacterium]|nr:hypothetical protein [Oscillospiraceae bacterium]